MNSISNKLTLSLNSECFLDFPSGKGSWNTGTDFCEDGNLITEEELLELVCNKHSPWKAENELSNEIILIKKDLIKNKGSNSFNFVKKRLRSLRLLNKNIKTLDNEFRAIDNIYDLILSANYISHVDAEYLPKNLKVLELYSNRVQSLEFCSQKDMPHLEHLGIGANHIVDISPLEVSVLRTTLVSLDLGKNYLTDLSSTISTISQLKSIKNLILAGNPLSLLAIYRGFVVDSIECLNCLDDTIISADERFSVKKMNAISKSQQKLCKFKISISTINNIPAKEIPENMPEEPIVKTEFYIKFWFPFHNIDKIEAQNSKDQETTDCEIATVDDVSADVSADAEMMYLHKSESQLRLNPEITFNFNEDISIDDVGIFCKFLDEPFRISVMEETKYLYSPENVPSKAPVRAESQTSKRRVQNKSATNKHDQKDAKKPKKDTGKKKKIDESKLVLYSKTVRTIAEYLVNISDFKNGETNFEQILKADFIPRCDINESENKSKKSHDTKPKKLSAKERAKSPEKSNQGKGAKTPAAATDQIESIKSVECHLILNLLTIKNVKQLDSC